MQLAKPDPIALLICLLTSMSFFSFNKAHAQNTSVCVKNDEYCPAIEAQVNALFEIAEETLKTKVIPTVEQIEARLGVVSTRSKGTDAYRIHPFHRTHVEFKTPHLVSEGSHNTTIFKTGAVAINFAVSIDNKHVCIQIDDLKSRLPGGKDEVRGGNRFTGERIQPVAYVHYVVEGDPKLYMSFSYIYQPCLVNFRMSVRKSKGE